MNPFHRPVSKSLLRRLFSFLALSGCLLACSADSGEAPDPSVLRLPVTRDTIISAYPPERDGNSGGAGRLKLKGWQESTLLDIDPEPLRGRVVRKARIHVRSAAPDWPLARVGVSTVASPWNEGTATGYRPQTGSACFDQAALGERDWAEPGGNLMDAVFGMGGTFWRFADAAPPDADGRQSVPVDPAAVAARVAGVSHGFLLWDEVGSEWACRNGRFEYFVFPNRFLYSRESIRSAPWMEVFLGEEDRTPPEAIPEILSETDGLPAGEAAFHWMTPPDRGPAGTIGFHARLDGAGSTGYGSRGAPIPNSGGGKDRREGFHASPEPGSFSEYRVSAPGPAGGRRRQRGALDRNPVPPIARTPSDFGSGPGAPIVFRRGRLADGERNPGGGARRPGQDRSGFGPDSSGAAAGIPNRQPPVLGRNRAHPASGGPERNRGFPDSSVGTGFRCFGGPVPGPAGGVPDRAFRVRPRPGRGPGTARSPDSRPGSGLGAGTRRGPGPFRPPCAPRRDPRARRRGSGTATGNPSDRIRRRNSRSAGGT
jgi:hypothetical protein